MAVYVDSACIRKGKYRYCHFTADTMEEMHAFADRMGWKRSWFDQSARQALAFRPGKDSAIAN